MTVPPCNLCSFTGSAFLLLLLLFFLFALLPLSPPAHPRSINVSHATHDRKLCFPFRLSSFDAVHLTRLALIPSFCLPSSPSKSVCGLWPWLSSISSDLSSVSVLLRPSLLFLFVVVKSFGILLSKLFCNYFHLPCHAIPLLLDPLTPLFLLPSLLHHQL